MDVLAKLSLAGIIPAIRVEDASDAYPLCAALKAGGLPVAEFTFRTPAAARAIEIVHEKLPDILLGAGTVLTRAQVDQAVAAGATYIVSPGLNPKVVERCQELGVPSLPGCATPSDIERALELGIRTVKFFPADTLGGLKAIKALSGPYGEMNYVPTGGVNPINLAEYLSHPKVRAVGGSWMAPADAVAAKDWARIEALAREAVDTVLGVQIRHIGINGAPGQDAEVEAKKLAELLRWPVENREKSVYVGEGFELMKTPFKGTNGHIALAVNDVNRAMYHMGNRGFAFEEPSSFQNGKPAIVYLKGEIGGFAIHLMQK